MVWIKLAISKLEINIVRFLLALMILTLPGCDSDGSGTDGFVQINTAPGNYTIEDLKEFGFKTSKHYDVEGLDGGLDAWKGFWGLDPYERHDYEIRFYASHDLAISSGKPIAIESTGAYFEADRDTFIKSGDQSGYRIFKKKQTWKEGVKDRWQANPLGSVGPTYQDWTILGNMVILCDGLDSDEALIRCTELIDNFLSFKEG